MYNERAQVGASALTHKVPTMSASAEPVPYGAALSYGPDFPDFFRRAVGYLDKILKGATPGDLPIEQPTRLKLVINLKAAKKLGSLSRTRRGDRIRLATSGFGTNRLDRLA